MMSRDEITQFKSTHYSLEKKIEEIGKKQCAAIVKLSELLKELMDSIESTTEREKSLTNPDIVTKIKIAKKGIRLSKKVEYFEADVVKEFEAGNISQDIGKTFFSITDQIKNGKMVLAKKEFDHFLKIVEMSKKFEASNEEMDKKDRLLRKELHRIRNLLDEMASIEDTKIDMEKVRRYGDFLEHLEKLDVIRHEYISSLTSKPVVHLLGVAESIRSLFPDIPAEEALDEMKGFFSEYPALGEYKVDQLCELFDFSEKKLAHVCPETTKFKRFITTRRKWFDELNNLKRTDFLVVDGGDDKALDFYAEEIEGEHSCKAEHERNNEFEEKKKELSKYSKDALQKELDEIESLLGLLHSEPKIEEKKEGKGLFASFLSLFQDQR
jgi:hypothetical protein